MMGHFHAPPNMVNNLVQLLSQVHIRVCSPHATKPSISIIFIMATLKSALSQTQTPTSNINNTNVTDNMLVLFLLGSFLGFLSWDNQIN